MKYCITRHGPGFGFFEWFLGLGDFLFLDPMINYDPRLDPDSPFYDPIFAKQIA